MTVYATSGASAPTIIPASERSGFSALGQADFLKLMTVQMQQQDPFDPVDQKEMLAQMAQFSSLAGIAEMNDTLKAIAGKLGVDLTPPGGAEVLPGGDADPEATT